MTESYQGVVGSNPTGGWGRGLARSKTSSMIRKPAPVYGAMRSKKQPVNEGSNPSDPINLKFQKRF